MADCSYDTAPPWPSTNVADFRRFVPAYTEEPLPNQLRASFDCHGPLLVKKPPRKLRQRRPYWSVIYYMKLAVNSYQIKKTKKRKCVWLKSAKRPGGFKYLAVSTRKIFGLFSLCVKQWKAGPHHCCLPERCSSAEASGRRVVTSAILNFTSTRFVIIVVLTVLLHMIITSWTCQSIGGERLVVSTQNSNDFLPHGLVK